MKRLITENLPFKIISLVVALVLYLFVMNQKEDVRDFIVPVRVEQNLDGYVLLTDIPDLRVVLEGRVRNLAAIEGNQLQDVVVRLNETEPIVQFSASDFDLPPGVQVRSIFPESVQLSYAELTSRELPIIVNTRGRPDPDYSVVDIRVVPDRIRVVGPESSIEDLTGIFTTPIDIYETDTEDIIRPNVELVPLGSYMSFDRSTNISVTIDIEPNEDTTQMTLPIEIEGPSDRFALEDPSVFVRVWLIGPPTIVSGAEPINARVVVDTTELEDAAAGRYFLDPQVLNLPPGVRVDQIDPPSIAVIVSSVERSEVVYLPVPMPVPFALPIPTAAAVLMPEEPSGPE